MMRLLAFVVLSYSVASAKEGNKEKENELQVEKEAQKRAPIQVLSVKTFQVEGQATGSLLGGTQLRIKVTGLDTQVANNKVSICDLPCEIPDDGIEGNDLKCIIAPQPNNANLPSDSFFQSPTPQYCHVTVKVKDKKPQEFQEQNSYKQIFTNSLSSTPQIYQVIPSSFYPNQTIIWRQPYFYQTQQAGIKQDFKLGDKSCAPPESNSNRIVHLYYYPQQVTQCVVPLKMEAGIYKLDINSPLGYSYSGFSTYKKRVYKDELYQVVVVPIIRKISNNLVRKNGQVLKIDGYGFSQNKSNIKVDANGYTSNIEILKANHNQIIVSFKNFTYKNQNNFLQGSGLRHTRYSLKNNTLYDSCPKFRLQLLNNISSLNDLIILDEVTLEIDSYNQFGNDVNYSDYYRGFFKAPKTGKYRFYLQSGDWSAVFIQTQPNIINQSNLTMIIQNDRGEYRQYYQEYLDKTYKSHRSDYISFQENNYYYIEIIHCSYFSMINHLTVSLEIEENQPTQRSIQDVYVLNSSYIFVPNKYEIYIYNNESDVLLEGKYQFIVPVPYEMMAPVLQDFYKDFYKNFNHYLRYNASIEEMRSYCNYLYNAYLFTTSIIVREQVDFTGKVIDQNKQNFAGYKYTFTTSWNNNQFEQFSIDLIANKQSKKIGKPYFNFKQINGSSMISGNLQLQFKYYDQKGEIQNTVISSLNYVQQIGFQNQSFIDINNINCGQLVNLIQISINKFPVCQQNNIQQQFWGFQNLIYFNDFPELIDITILTSNLKAGNQTVQALITKIQESSNNTFYEPIPQELLYTFNSKPQINVYVNDILASCFDDNCQFYQKDSQSFTLLNFTLNQSNIILFIQTPDFTNLTIDKLNIKYGGSQCDKVILESQQQTHKISCLLDQLNGKPIIEAGANLPQVHVEELGYPNIGQDVKPILQEIQIQSIQPNKVSTTGGAILTLNGIGFARDLNDKDFQIKISGKNLNPISVNNQEIVVEVPEKQTDSTIEINYRGQVFISSSLFQYEDVKTIIIQSLEFNDVNPVFKGYLKIQADNLEEDVELLDCLLVNANKTYIAPIKSLQQNILTVYLRGGMPGDYKIIINNRNYGRSKPSNENSNKFQYGVFVTNINPQQGSNGGGNLITISGRNFVLEETIVFIGQSLQCDLDLDLSTNTSIVCLTQPRPEISQYDLPQQVAVITRGSLESTCEIGSQCTFQYLTSQTTIIKRLPINTYDAYTPRLLVQGDIETKSHINNFKSQKTKDNILNQEHLNNHQNRRILQDDQYKLVSMKVYSSSQQEQEVVFLNYSSPIVQYSIYFKGIQGSYSIDANYDPKDSFNLPSLTFSIQNLPQGDYQTYVKSLNGYADQTWVSRFVFIIISASQSHIGSYGSEIYITGYGFNIQQKFSIEIDGNKCENVQVLSSTSATCIYKSHLAANLVKITQLDSKDDTLLEQNLTIQGSQLSNMALYDLAQSPNLLANQDNINYVGDLNQINLVLNGKGLSGSEYSTQSLEKFVYFQSSNGKINGSLSIASSDVQLIAQFQNVPIGRYSIIYAIGPQNQKTYLQTNFQLYIQGQNYITANSVVSSIAGGALLVLQGQGFDQTKENNQVKVCGFPCNILSTDNNQLTCEIPALLTSDILQQYPKLQQDFKKIDSEYLSAQLSDTQLNKDAYKLFDGTQLTCLYLDQPSSYIILEIDNQLDLEIQFIRYSTTVLSLYFGMNGIKFQYFSSDSQDWINIATIGENVEFGYNTIYLKDSIKNVKKLRIYYEQFLGKIFLCELQIFGRLTYASKKSYNDDQLCDAQLTINDFIYPSFQQVIKYQATKTPVVTQVSREYVPTDYQTEIQIFGSGFGNNQNLVKVSIDSVNCQVTQVQANFIKCTTGIKDLSINQITGVFRVQIDNNLAINQQIVQYGNLWSEIETWGGAVFPSDGDSVIVQKGQTLIVDVITPKLISVFVEGTLLFADNGKLNQLNAIYIIIHNGKFQIGSEDKPYQSQATINLRGEISDIQLGVYGNKALACQSCQFLVYGQKRTPVWTSLAQTVQVGGTQLTLDQEVDWRIGEQIVITSSDFDQLQTEVHIITQISTDKKTITIQQPFQYQHYSDVEIYDTQKLNNKVQVGLLSRNIKITGEQSLNDYGFHFTVYGNQVTGTQVQISYVEFVNGGQPQIQGRHPIYFKQNKVLYNNYLIGNSIYNNNARCITISNAQQLLIDNNICYNTFGHSIHLATGNEISNIVSNNLIAVTKKIDILSQSDISPASYYITNPQNTIIQNIAAGSDYSGFTLDFKSTADLDTYDCRSSQVVTNFSYNQAYSHSYYGLKILTYIPNLNCSQSPRDLNAQLPFQKFISIKSTIAGFNARLNGQFGIYVQQIGDVKFSQMQFSDNKIAALFIRETDWTQDGFLLDDSLIIGHSKIASSINFSPSAIILPGTEFFSVTNTQISNFNENDVIFKVDFSILNEYLQQNFYIPYHFKGIKVKNSQNTKYTDESFYKGIIIDEDGTLLNNKKPSQIIPQKRHLQNLEGCQIQTQQWDKLLLCEIGKVSLRDLTIIKVTANQAFYVNQRIIRRLNLDQLSQNETGFQTDQYQFDSSESVYATNNIYNIHFSQGANEQINPNSIIIMESNYLVDDDKGTIFRFNFSMIVQNVTIQTLFRGSFSLKNASNVQTIPNLADCTNADWYLDNNTNYLYVCFSSKEKTIYEQVQITIDYKHEEITIDEIEDVVIPDALPYPCGKLLWSNPSTWPLGILPNSGQQKIIIYKCQEITLDIDPPNLQQLEVYGSLIFDETRPSITLNVRNIAIISGRISAGNETHPYKGIINIYINGDQYTNQFLVAGYLELFGNPPRFVFSRLIEFASKGDQKIVVEGAIGWQSGDSIVIGPSGSDPSQTEEAIIESIVDNNVNLKAPLKYNHYGAPGITIFKENIGQLDMRAVVGHISRNIKIISGQTQNQFGCQIQVQNYRGNVGYLTLIGVEVWKCGQLQSELLDRHPALDINSVSGYDYVINKCSFHYSSGSFLRIQSSGNFIITGNVFYDGQDELVYINSNTQVLFVSNLLIQTKGAFARFITTENMRVISNIGTGSYGSGFILSTSACIDKQHTQFHDNQCSSVSFACYWYQYNTGNCDFVGRVSAYHSSIGVLASLPTNQIYISELILVENALSLQTRMENTQVTSNSMFLSNSFISSFARPDCKQCYNNDLKPYCSGTVGIQLSTVSDKFNLEINPFHFKFVDRVNSIEAVDARVYVNSLTLDGFKDIYDETPYCGSNAAFRQNQLAYDMTAQYYLMNTKCQNCNQNGLLYGLKQPDPALVGWLGGCGTFICTGLQNILIEDQDGSLFGSPSQAIANNEYFGPNVTSCKKVEKWQGYLCDANRITILNFMSTAPDRNKRLYSPIQLTDGIFFNQINSFREWQWDGGQPQNKRESKFVAIININTIINMTNAGDNPTESVYWLSKKYSYVFSANNWIILKWQFNSPNMIQISVNGAVIQPGITENNDHWDLSTKLRLCGANNYFFENKTIHFVVTDQLDCFVKVSLKNSIKVTSRITVTEEQFVGKNFLQYAFAQLGGDPYNYFIIGIRKSNRRQLQGGSFEVDWVYADPAPVGTTEANNVDQRLDEIAQKVQNIQASPSSPYNIVSSTVVKSVIDINAYKSTEPTTTTPSTPQVDIVLVPVVPSGTNSTPNTTDPDQQKNNKTTEGNSNPKQESEESYKIIIGVVVGCVVGIGIIVAFVYYYMRLRKTSKVINEDFQIPQTSPSDEKMQTN